jgi:hypothetical protein
LSAHCCDIAKAKTIRGVVPKTSATLSVLTSTLPTTSEN